MLQGAGDGLLWVFAVLHFDAGKAGGWVGVCAADVRCPFRADLDVGSVLGDDPGCEDFEVMDVSPRLLIALIAIYAAAQLGHWVFRCDDKQGGHLV